MNGLAPLYISTDNLIHKLKPDQPRKIDSVQFLMSLNDWYVLVAQYFILNIY